MSTMKVMAVKGRLVLQPELENAPLPEGEPVTVERNSFYLNHVRAGDLVEVKDGDDTATSTTSKRTSTGVDAHGHEYEGQPALMAEETAAGGTASGTVGNAVNGTGTQTGTAGAHESPSLTADTQGAEGDGADRAKTGSTPATDAATAPADEKPKDATTGTGTAAPAAASGSSATKTDKAAPKT